MSPEKYSSGSTMQLQKERAYKRSHRGRKASSTSQDNISLHQSKKNQHNS